MLPLAGGRLGRQGSWTPGEIQGGCSAPQDYLVGGLDRPEIGAVLAAGMSWLTLSLLSMESPELLGSCSIELRLGRRGGRRGNLFPLASLVEAGWVGMGLDGSRAQDLLG